MFGLKTKILKLIISSNSYCERRRQKMVNMARDFEQNAAWHFKDPIPGHYTYYSEQGFMYRKRAAWYSYKMRENGIR